MSEATRQAQRDALIMHQLQAIREAAEFGRQQVWGEEKLIERYALSGREELRALLRKHKLLAKRFPPARGAIRLHARHVAELDEAIRPKLGGK